MNFDKINELGLEKLANKNKEKEIQKLQYLANSENAPKEVVEEAKAKLRELKKDNLEKEAAAEDSVRYTDEGAKRHERNYMLQSGGLNALSGALSGGAIGSIKGGRKGAALGALGGGALSAGVGAGSAKVMSPAIRKLHEAQANLEGNNPLSRFQKKRLRKYINKHNEKAKEKTASEAESIYIDGLEKIAAVTGVDPEILDEAIGMYTDEMIKEAQINGFLESISEEEAGEILKEAAANDEEIKEMIAELEEAHEDQELEKMASAINELSDEEVEEILAEIGE